MGALAKRLDRLERAHLKAWCVVAKAPVGSSAPDARSRKPMTVEDWAWRFCGGDDAGD